MCSIFTSKKFKYLGIQNPRSPTDYIETINLPIRSSDTPKLKSMIVDTSSYPK